MFCSLRGTPFTLQHRYGDASVLFKVLSCMREPFRGRVSAPSIHARKQGQQLPPGLQRSNILLPEHHIRYRSCKVVAKAARDSHLLYRLWLHTAEEEWPTGGCSRKQDLQSQNVTYEAIRRWMPPLIIDIIRNRFGKHASLPVGARG